MTDGILSQRSSEGSFTKHAIVSGFSLDPIKIKLGWQIIHCLVQETALGVAVLALIQERVGLVSLRVSDSTA
jgi:hypothetical protein